MQRHFFSLYWCKSLLQYCRFYITWHLAWGHWNFSSLPVMLADFLLRAECILLISFSGFQRWTETFCTDCSLSVVRGPGSRTASSLLLEGRRLGWWVGPCSSQIISSRSTPRSLSDASKTYPAETHAASAASYSTLFYPQPSFEMLREAQQEEASRPGSKSFFDLSPFFLSLSFCVCECRHIHKAGDRYPVLLINLRLLSAISSSLL